MPPFDVTYIGAMDPGAIGVVFLAPAFLGTKASNV